MKLEPVLQAYAQGINERSKLLTENQNLSAQYNEQMAVLKGVVDVQDLDKFNDWNEVHERNEKRITELEDDILKHQDLILDYLNSHPLINSIKFRVSFGEEQYSLMVSRVTGSPKDLALVEAPGA